MSFVGRGFGQGLVGQRGKGQEALFFLLTTHNSLLTKILTKKENYLTCPVPFTTFVCSRLRERI